MSIFDKYIKTSKTSDQSNNLDRPSESATSIERDSLSEGANVSGRRHQYAGGFEDTKIDDELPSVNRHRRTNNTSKIIGLITLLGLGAIMLYVIFTPKKVVQKAVEKMEVELPCRHYLNLHHQLLRLYRSLQLRFRLLSRLH